LRKLDDPYKYFPYRWGQAFWSYVGGRWGDEAIGRLLKRAGNAGSLQQALVRTLGISDSTLSADWHESIKAAYAPIASATKGPADGKQFVFGGVRHGKPVLSIIDVKSGNVVREVPLNDLGEIFNPTWSPDGRYIAFSALVGGLMDLYIYDLQDSLLKRMTNDA